MANGTMIFRQWPQIVGIEDPPKWQTRRGVGDDIEFEFFNDGERNATIYTFDKHGKRRAKWWVGQKLTIMSGRGKPAIWRWWSNGNDDGEPSGTMYSVGDESPYGEGERCYITITALRVERVQDISVADEIAEGVKDEGGYRDLFTSINGPKSWDANPKVAVITFRYED